MNPRFPKMSDAQIVARKAEKVFEDLLASDEWLDVKIPQERDFGIDYRVEAVHDGELRGCEFYAQVKGYQSISDPGDIRFSVKASTARYWKTKLLPVLLAAIDCESRNGFFTWFDKSLHQAEDQSSVNFSFRNAEQLTSSFLRRSLDPYYRTFARQLMEGRRHAFYRELFSESLLMMHLLLQTNNNLLFDPERSPVRRREYLSHYFKVLSVFLKHLALYGAHVDLTTNPVDERLSAMLAQVRDLHEGMYLSSESAESQERFLVDEERIFASLPNVSSIFSDITLFFRKWLLHEVD